MNGRSEIKEGDKKCMYFFAFRSVEIFKKVRKNIKLKVCAMNFLYRIYHFLYTWAVFCMTYLISVSSLPGMRLERRREEVFSVSLTFIWFGISLSFFLFSHSPTEPRVPPIVLCD